MEGQETLVPSAAGQEVTIHLQNINPARYAAPSLGWDRLRGPPGEGVLPAVPGSDPSYLRELVILIVKGEGPELGAVPVLLLVRPHPAHLQRHRAAASAEGGSGCLGGITTPAPGPAPGPAARGPCLTSPPLPRQQHRRPHGEAGQDSRARGTPAHGVLPLGAARPLLILALRVPACPAGRIDVPSDYQSQRAASAAVRRLGQQPASGLWELWTDSGICGSAGTGRDGTGPVCQPQLQLPAARRNQLAGRN